MVSVKLLSEKKTWVRKMRRHLPTFDIDGSKVNAALLAKAVGSATKFDLKHHLNKKLANN